jgi:hypothetical protein
MAVIGDYVVPVAAWTIPPPADWPHIVRSIRGLMREVERLRNGSSHLELRVNRVEGRLDMIYEGISALLEETSKTTGMVLYIRLKSKIIPAIHEGLNQIKDSCPEQWQHPVRFFIHPVGSAVGAWWLKDLEDEFEELIATLRVLGVGVFEGILEVFFLWRSCTS